MAGEGTYVDLSERNFSLSTPFSIVKGQFANAQEFAESAHQRTNEYLDTLMETIQDLETPDTSDIDDVVLPDVGDFDVITRPGLSDLDLNTTLPTPTAQKPTLASLPDIPILDIPDYTFPEFFWSDVAKPTVSNQVAPGDVPTLSEVEDVEAPVLQEPVLPVITMPTLASVPDVTIDDFESSIGALEILNRPDGMQFNPEDYSSDIWQALMAKMLHDIEEGGTGLPEDVELGMWERAKNRALDEYTNTIRDIELKFGQNGLGLPSGALVSAIMALEADWATKMTDLGYSISEAQAKLAQTNSHFIVEQGLKCEDMLRTFYNSQQDRVLDVAYKLVTSNIELYKAIQAEQNLRIQWLQAEISQQDAKIKVAQMRLEAFKAEIEGAKLSVDVQALLVDLYNKQLSALETRVRLYATQVEAATNKLNRNNQLLEAFKTSIEAYTSSLASDKLKYDIYVQELTGEQTKADVMKTQAAAYDSFVSALAKKQEAYIGRSDSTVRQNLALIDVYKADLQADELHINSTLKALEAQVTGLQAEATAYSAETSGLTAYYAAKESQVRAALDKATFTLNKAIATVKAVTDGYVALNSLKIEGLKGTANTGAQLAASALSGIHASSSVGYNSGETMNESWSHGDNITESHNFDETPT